MASDLAFIEQDPLFLIFHRLQKELGLFFTHLPLFFRPIFFAVKTSALPMESRFRPRPRLRQEGAMAFDRRLHWDSAILPVVPDRALIVDPVRQRTDWAWRWHFCFLPFRKRVKVDSLAVDFSPAMAMEFRPVAAADFFAVRSWPAPGSTCPENFCSGCFLIDFAIAPAGSVVVAAAGFDFDLCRNCSAIEIVAGLGPVRRRRRFVADSCLFYFAVAVAALVFVSDAVSTARSSF